MLAVILSVLFLATVSFMGVYKDFHFLQRISKTMTGAGHLFSHVVYGHFSPRSTYSVSFDLHPSGGGFFVLL